MHLGIFDYHFGGHQVKFLHLNPATNVDQTAGSVHADPARKDLHGQTIPGPFDNTLINDSTGRDTGFGFTVSSSCKLVISLKKFSKLIQHFQDTA